MATQDNTGPYLTYEQAILWLKAIAVDSHNSSTSALVERLLKESVSHARRAAGAKGLLKQGKTLKAKKKRKSAQKDGGSMALKEGERAVIEEL